MRAAAGHAENKAGRFTWRAVHRVLYIELYGKGSQMTTNHFDIEVFHIYYAAGGMI